MQKRVTLSLDDSVYKDFQKFCEDNDIIVSKRIERLMKEMLEQNKKVVKK
jgi:hypothetical protein